MQADQTEANRHAVLLAFDGWRIGAAPITELFAPDMRWRIEGRSVKAGEYRDAAAFVDEVLTPFAARFPASAPFRPTSIRSVSADGDTVIVLWDGRGTANDSVPYENSYAWFLRMRDGKVVDGTAFFDSIAFNELWDRVVPRR